VSQTTDTDLRPRRYPDQDFEVADLSLAEWGRKEIGLAEREMPGLMALRERFADTKPLERAPASPAACT
jgi:adenosylhomocysteinase